MRKCCNGLGVFDTKDAECYSLSKDSNDQPEQLDLESDHLMFGLNNAENWIHQHTPVIYGDLKLELHTPAEAEEIFTKYGVDIPQILFDRLQKEG